jgi:hypothetical protein
MEGPLHPNDTVCYLMEGPLQPNVTQKKAKKKAKEIMNQVHSGFARCHQPHYWPSLNTLNFPEQTRGGAVVLV